MDHGSKCKMCNNKFLKENLDDLSQEFLDMISETHSPKKKKQLIRVIKI